MAVVSYVFAVCCRSLVFLVVRCLLLVGFWLFFVRCGMLPFVVVCSVDRRCWLLFAKCVLLSVVVLCVCCCSSLFVVAWR